MDCGKRGAGIELHGRGDIPESVLHGFGIHGEQHGLNADLGGLGGAFGGSKGGHRIFGREPHGE